MFWMFMSLHRLRLPRQAVFRSFPVEVLGSVRTRRPRTPGDAGRAPRTAPRRAGPSGRGASRLRLTEAPDIPSPAARPTRSPSGRRREVARLPSLVPGSIGLLELPPAHALHLRGDDLVDELPGVLLER